MRKFCNEHLESVQKKNNDTIDLIIKEYKKNNHPWYLGYSGGKDSSALLSLVFNAFIKMKKYKKEVLIIYCDTGVEIPTITEYVYNTLIKLQKEIKASNLPIKIKIAKPKIDDRYFVKVIGRGYPPPTNIFRWCTDRLRINPVQNLIDSTKESIVLLGVRNGESTERDKTILKHVTENEYYLNQNTASSTKIFSPIVNYNLRDIWSTLMYNKIPNSIDFMRIGELYKDAGSECPIYREEKGIPCGKGRFGCWTCTVVRKDKSVSSMVENGYSELKPLYDFRNWLIKFRDNNKFRCKKRRNGQSGLGPITLNGRKRILSNLLKVQNKGELTLITEDEIKRIKELWSIDVNNAKYCET